MKRRENWDCALVAWSDTVNCVPFEWGKTRLRFTGQGGRQSDVRRPTVNRTRLARLSQFLEELCKGH